MRILTRLLGLGLPMALSLPAFADEATYKANENPRVATIDMHGTLEAGAWRNVVNDTLLVQYGRTRSAIYDFGQGVSLDAMRVKLFQYVGDNCGAQIVSLNVKTSPTQPDFTVFRPDLNGEVAMDGASVFKAFVVFDQSLLRGGRCILRLDLWEGDGGPTPSDFELAGVVSYQGGFRDQQLVSVEATNKIVAFWARVPSFCQGLDILEAGTVTESVYERARLVDANQNIFEVNGGAGTRASAISISFNGPPDLRCDIPVYVKTVQ